MILSELPGAGGKKILVVDDNLVVLRSTTRILEGAGYEVVGAESGRACLALLETSHPDLVLLDIVLPDISGLEVLRQIKAMPSHAHLLVVIVSAMQTSSDHQSLGLESGADGYITRPISNRELVARVQSLLRVKQAENALLQANIEIEQRVAERTAELVKANAELRSEICARKQAEVELHRKTALLEAQINSTADGILIVDNQGRKVLQNQRTIDLWKIPKHIAEDDDDEAQVRHVMSMTRDPERFLEQIRHLYSHPDETSKDEIELTDGTVFDRYSAPVVGNDGQNYGRIWTFHDITERKRAEKALAHSHDLMRYIIEHNRSAIAVHDRDMRYVYVSQRYLDEYKVKEKDVIGKHHYDVFPDLPQKWRNVHQKALAGEISSAEDDPYVRADGTVDWTRWECRPWYEADGSIGGIIIYTEVVTQRKRAEEALRNNQQNLESLFNAIGESVSLFEPDGKILAVNKTFADRLGKRITDCLGTNIFNLIPPDVAARRQAIVGKVLCTGLPEVFEDERDGRWLSHSIYPVLNADGSVARLVVYAMDITERKQLEDKLRQAQKMEAIGQLAGGVAHDFNNIMAATMMQLGLLRRNTSLDREAQGMLNELMAGAKRAASLTAQLLMFSRRSVLEIQVLDLNEVVANLFQMLSRLIGEHISLRFDRGESLPAVDADARMIEQVVLNLAVNARDAMPKGGLLTIRLEPVQIDAQRAKGKSEVQPGRFVCLSVADTGCGMDEATLKHIFEPFFTTKDVGKGTGLGLATIHGIVAQHKGWVDVDSAPGKGTTFKVYFPASAKEPTAATQAGAQTVIRGHEMILLVEDEGGLRRLVAQGLRLLGYRVLEADNGQTAMTLWRENAGQIDLLFSDMIMPEGMTGMDLAEKLREEKPSLKTIISSGYNVEIDGRDKPIPGGIVYFQKPYEFEALSRIIRDCLDARA